MLYDRQYWREYGLWLALYLGLMLLLGHGLRGLGADSPWRALAVLPVLLAIAAGFWLELRNLRRRDEFERLIYSEATLAGFAAVIGWSCVQLVLEMLMSAPRLSPAWVLGVASGGFLIGWWLAWRRYR